ncbi:MAG: hypothetical protein ABIZ36_07455 [Gemmatimonadaceae bacterium]
MKPRSIKAATLGVALLAACSGDTIFEAPVTTEPPVVKAATHPILFASNRDPAFPRTQIFAMKTDGSEIVNLSRNLFTDVDPSWSPDGQQIAFASSRGNGSDIYVMKVDGSGLRRLTNDQLDDRRPRWSPDGKRIAFESGKEGLLPGLSFGARFSDIWVMETDGSHVTNITKTPNNSEWWVSWAPDGKTIAYTRLGASAVIMLVNPDGTNSRQFHAIDPRYTDDVAAWSPDGSRIAYSTFDKQSPQFTDLWYIFTARNDGTDVKQLTLPSTRYPAWSPDGMRIVYNRDGGNEFWARFGIVNVSVVNADGSNDRRLTSDPDKRNEVGSQAWAK